MKTKYFSMTIKQLKYIYSEAYILKNERIYSVRNQLKSVGSVFDSHV